MQQRQREKEKRREEEVKEDVAYPLYSRYLAEKGNSILPLSRNITRAKFAYLHFKSIFDTPSIGRQREMFIDVCTFNSLSIYAVTRLSAIIISTVENLSLSLSLSVSRGHYICRCTPRRGRDSSMLDKLTNRDKGETCKAVEWKTRFWTSTMRVSC